MHMGLGLASQPEPQYYFHRPIGMLFNTCFRHGFVLDWMEEPTYQEGMDVKPVRPLSWAHFHNIPQVLVARMRLVAP